MNEATKKEVAAAAAAIIFANEGNYSSVNANDNGAVSVGKVQWHGNRAEDGKRHSGGCALQRDCAGYGLGKPDCHGKRESGTVKAAGNAAGQGGAGQTSGSGYFILCDAWSGAGDRRPPEPCILCRFGKSRRRRGFKTCGRSGGAVCRGTGKSDASCNSCGGTG